MTSQDKAPIIDATIRGPSLFSGGARHLAVLHVGDPVGLIREPENPVDANAVVCTDRHENPLGYIDKRSVVRLAAWMDKGWVYFGRVIKSANVRTDENGRRYIARDSVFVRCFPIQPISLSRTVKQGSKVPVSQVEHETDSLYLF